MSEQRRNKLFSTNEHIGDRIVRILLGSCLLALLFVGPKTWWGLVGIVPLVTGLVGYCPLYTLLGINTCSTNEESPLNMTGA